MLKSKENELVFTLSPLLIKCARIIHTNHVSAPLPHVYRYRPVIAVAMEWFVEKMLELM